MKDILKKYGFSLQEEKIKEFDIKYSFNVISPIGDILKLNKNLLNKDNNRLFYYENNNKDLFDDKLNKINNKLKNVDNNLIKKETNNFLDSLILNKNILKLSDIDCLFNLDINSIKGIDYLLNNFNNLNFEKNAFEKLFNLMNDKQKLDVINSNYFKLIPYKEKQSITNLLGLNESETNRLVEANYF